MEGHPEHRRSFLKKSGVFTAGTLLVSPGFSFAHRPRFKMGLQLFTIRDAMAEDAIAALKTVAALGYEDLETYGYDAEKDTYYGYASADFKSILEDLQLTASSGHYAFSDHFEASEDALKRYVDQCIKGAKALGKTYITWPWLAPEHRTLDHFSILADKLNRIAEQVSSAGLGFAYHNHDFEFREQEGGIGYDILLNNTDPHLVKFQMDIYWVAHASKKSPVQWINENPGRFTMWHIKDMDKQTRDYTEMGNGSIDYVALLAAIDKKDLDYYYLEQGGNFALNSMQSIADSAAYFKKELQTYL
jgi:sugar phosphate isomerase/epimerase